MKRKKKKVLDNRFVITKSNNVSCYYKNTDKLGILCPRCNSKLERQENFWQKFNEDTDDFLKIKDGMRYHHRINEYYFEELEQMLFKYEDEPYNVLYTIFTCFSCENKIIEEGRKEFISIHNRNEISKEELFDFFNKKQIKPPEFLILKLNQFNKQLEANWIIDKNKIFDLISFYYEDEDII